VSPSAAVIASADDDAVGVTAVAQQHALGDAFVGARPDPRGDAETHENVAVAELLDVVDSSTSSVSAVSGLTAR
jgi:hypothetical protein